MPSSSLFTRLVTGDIRRKKSIATNPRFEEELIETPMSRVPLGQGKSRTVDSQPESSQLPPDRNSRKAD